MREARESSWSRRGMSLLWGAQALAEVARPEEVVSIRTFFATARQWPEELPSRRGSALVVAGVEGCLDALSPSDAAAWLEAELVPCLHGFQQEYQGQAGLVLWLPTGRQRIQMKPATESYLWRCAPPSQNEVLELGRILWGGAESDARRILDNKEKNQDVDGPAWVGLHLVWVS